MKSYLVRQNNSCQFASGALFALVGRVVRRRVAVHFGRRQPFLIFLRLLQVEIRSILRLGPILAARRSSSEIVPRRKKTSTTTRFARRVRSDFRFSFIELWFPAQRRFRIHQSGSDVEIWICFGSRRIKPQRLSAHLSHQALLVQIRFEKPAEAVELHQIVNLLLRGRKKSGRGRFESVDGSLTGVRVDVDRFLSARGQMSSDDIACDASTFVERTVAAQTSVALARRPEVDVFMAEFLFKKFLKTDFNKLNCNLKRH